MFENHDQSFQRIFSFGKTGKKWNAAPRHIVAGPKPLNYTIFKALAKKDGSRKQLHPWQVSKVSQLQYYLVKVLQVNEFFTRLKNARRFPSFGTFINNEMLQNFEGKITAWYMEF